MERRLSDLLTAHAWQSPAAGFDEIYNSPAMKEIRRKMFWRTEVHAPGIVTRRPMMCRKTQVQQMTDSLWGEACNLHVEIDLSCIAATTFDALRCRDFSVNPILCCLPIQRSSTLAQRGAWIVRLWRTASDAKIVCVDMFEGSGVDLVADAHDMYMVPGSSVDCVVTVSTLEHPVPTWGGCRDLSDFETRWTTVRQRPLCVSFHADPGSCVSPATGKHR
jgi:hypothetical protein